MTRLPTKKPGFTLLELLVVISIISLLMGLMMPMLRRAREQSKQLVCRKNLSDVWRGVILYSVEFSDRVPFMERVGPDVDPFDRSEPTVVGTVLGPYVDRLSFVCPSAVAGYPETDPKSRRKWKLTYDFSTADRIGDSVPYDEARGAFSGEAPDPAVINDYHFDGRPMRMLTVQRDEPQRGSDDPPPAPPLPGEKVEIIWSVSVPLVADSLGEDKPGDLLAGRPRYPHRGLVRRHSDVFRSLFATADPRLVPPRRPGYFQMHVEDERPEIFLTRYTPDNDPED